MNRTQLGNPAGPGQATGLILDYQPRQVTGWGGFTLGGHVADHDFTFQDTAYTVSLMPLGQPGGSGQLPPDSRRSMGLVLFIQVPGRVPRPG